MKKTWVVGILVATASAQARSFVLQQHNFADLNVDAKKVTLNIGYPGMGGKSCGIELRTSNQFGPSNGMNALAEALSIKEGYRDPEAIAAEETRPGYAPTLRYVFPKTPLQTYMTLVRIETKDGSSLAKTITRTVLPGTHDDPKPRVIATLIDCE